MAEALLGILLENVIPLVQREFAAFSGIKEKTEDLSHTLAFIKKVLDDAKEKQWSNPPIKIWLQRLKDATYVLDDVLDQLPTESSQHGWLSSFKPNNIMLRGKVGHELNEIVRRLDRIAEDKNKFLLREGVRERPTEVAEWRQTSPTIISPQVLGRDADKEKVVEFLLSPARNSEFLSVYPMVGLGGLGKTTLAQLVYHDERVSSHFNLKIWLCISETFNVRRILCSIVQSITKNECKVLELPVMEEKVKGLLQGKKFLLVLDDVWVKNQQLEFGLNEDKWDQLKSVLCCGSKGASILVSTRDKDVATIMGAYQTHDLSGLSEDDCWSLFRQRAFRPDKAEDEELVKIGKEIVSKCGGSPLAAKALGGLMRSRNTRNEWLEVKESSLWTLPNENHILPALRLSYFHLPPTLKQCFAFCAIFPKDESIKKQELIHLWMANGFISSRANLDVEEVGNMIWNELFQKSFFQDVEINDYSGDVSFKMHDLVHDLAQSITEKECMCLEEANHTDLPKNTHHIGFKCDEVTETPFRKGACEKTESLRTLYDLNWYAPRNASYFCPTNISLRVLCTYTSKFPSVENFSHLRYLGLCDLEIKTIPDSIYSLHKLEILKLMQSKGHSLAELRDLNLGRELCINGLGNVSSVSEAEDANLKGKQDLRVLYLPWENSGETKSVAVEEILEALQPHSNLKRLDIAGYGGLHLPTWMGNMRYIEEDESYEGIEAKPFPALEQLTMSDLPKVERLLKRETTHMFPSLSTLEITYCSKLQLPCLPRARSLFVSGCKNKSVRSISNLNGLNKLEVWNCEDVSYFPEGMMSNMTSLATLEIVSCRELKELPSDITKLTALSDLIIEDCRKLECLPEQGWKGLSSLRKLSIFGCHSLASLPEGVRHLTSLQSLTIGGCPALRERCKEGTGEDWHKIAHIPKVYLGDSDSDL
ncbi:hypothetical protein AHAS_Ahas19G0033600 [Arachis hypogaea]